MTFKPTPAPRKHSLGDDLGGSSGSSDCLVLSVASTNTDVSLKLNCRPIDTRLSFYKSANAGNESPDTKHPPSLNTVTDRRPSISSSTSKLYRYKMESQIISPLNRELVVKSADRLTRPVRPVRLITTANYRSYSKLHSIKTNEILKEKPKTAAVTHSFDREHGDSRELRSKVMSTNDYVLAWIKYHQQYGFLPVTKDETPSQNAPVETTASSEHHQGGENSEQKPQVENVSQFPVAEMMHEVKNERKMPKTVTLREYPDDIGPNLVQLQNEQANNPYLTAHRHTYDTTKSKLLGSMRSGFSNHLRGPVASSHSHHRSSHYQPLIDLTISQNQPISSKPEPDNACHWANKMGHGMQLENSIPCDSKNNWAEGRYDWLYSSEPAVCKDQLRHTERTTDHHDLSSRQRFTSNLAPEWRKHISLRMANEESSFTQVVKLNRNTHQRLARTTQFLGGSSYHHNTTYF